MLWRAYVNVGSGEEISIYDLATTIKDVIGYHGMLVQNTEKPDGTPRKLMDSGKLQRMGWQPTINLKEGIEKTYKDYNGTK